MSKNNRNPARHVTGGGAGNVDQAGKRVGHPYSSEMRTRKAPSFFEQLESLALRTKVAAEFEHYYGKNPPGKGWWSPVEEGEPEDHHVRYIGRRRRP